MLITQLPRGTKDIYGEEIRLWHKVEDVMREVCRLFGYNEIRTPMFEHTELFVRGVGEGTDIVQKEMYTFNDKGNRSITLRPEGTAGAARAYIEHSMYAEPAPTKLYYISPVFRYEKPEAGRFRQFHQFGIESYGSYSPASDAEVISLAYEIIKRLGLKNISLHLNSLGGAECRRQYNERLKAYLNENAKNLCETCNERLVKNPLRVLDCKNEGCKDTIKNAPSILEGLGTECRTHFEDLMSILIKMNIPFYVDSGIVRGLDYYTKTVFEFISNDIGSQSTVCGGGRYDSLIEECGGPKTGSVGFGMGIERLILALSANKSEETSSSNPHVFIGYIGKGGLTHAQSLTLDLRRKGFIAETDTVNRSVKAQLKYADKIKAAYSCIIGDDEILNKQINLKNMATGESTLVEWSNLPLVLSNAIGL